MDTHPLPVLALVCERTGNRAALAEVAATLASRRRGLLGRDGLEAGRGLLLRPCSSIHTWFMRFPIDVVFLDSDGTVLGSESDVGPFRVVWGGWRTRDTLELPAGTVSSIGLRVGDRLVVDS